MDRIFLYNDSIGYCQTLDYMGTDLTIVNSARVSFDVTHQELEPRDEKLIHYLYTNKHTSPFEHCSVKFECNVPLFVARQHMRHRTWSFNEVSRRYTDVNLEFYLPDEFRPQAETNRQASVHDGAMVNPVLQVVHGSNQVWPTTANEMLKSHTRKSVKLYNQMLEGGICREQARGVLPQNLYTEYYGTCNLNNLLKFVDLRIHEGAQWEIQRVAEALLELTTDLWPTAVNAYRENKNK